MLGFGRCAFWFLHDRQCRPGVSLGMQAQAERAESVSMSRISNSRTPRAQALYPRRTTVSGYSLGAWRTPLCQRPRRYHRVGDLLSTRTFNLPSFSSMCTGLIQTLLPPHIVQYDVESASKHGGRSDIGSRVMHKKTWPSRDTYGVMATPSGVGCIRYGVAWSRDLGSRCRVFGLG